QEVIQVELASQGVGDAGGLMGQLLELAVAQVGRVAEGHALVLVEQVVARVSLPAVHGHVVPEVDEPGTELFGEGFESSVVGGDAPAADDGDPQAAQPAAPRAPGRMGAAVGRAARYHRRASSHDRLGGRPRAALLVSMRIDDRGRRTACSPAGRGDRSAVTPARPKILAANWNQEHDPALATW